MPRRLMHSACCPPLSAALLALLPALLLPLAAFADPAAERSALLERARVMQDEAKAEEKAADALFKTESDACYKKFQINSCLEAARKKHIASLRDAKRKALAGDEIERDVRRSDLAAKDAQRASAAPQRAIEQAEKAAEYRAAEAAKAEARADRLAKKEQQAAAGRAKQSQAEARRQKKQAAHAAKEAKAAAKRQKRALQEREKAAAEASSTSAASPD